MLSGLAAAGALHCLQVVGRRPDRSLDHARSCLGHQGHEGRQGPGERPTDSTVWEQKDEALALLKKHRILNNKLAGKLKIPNSQLESYLRGLRYPSPDTQSRIMTALDALIVAKGVKSESKP